MSGRHCYFRCEGKHSLKRLPKEDEVRTRWLKFIFSTVPEEYSPNIYLCSRHFTEHCFMNWAQFKAGFSQRLFLKEGAVPTLLGNSVKDSGAEHLINHHPECGLDTAGIVEHLIRKNWRTAANLIVKHKELYEQIKEHIPKEELVHSVRYRTTQTDPPKTKSVGTQLSRKTLQYHIRSKATQVTVPTRDCGVSTVTFPLNSPLLLLQPTTVQRPSKRPRLSIKEEEEEEEEEPSEYSSSTKVYKPEDST